MSALPAVFSMACAADDALHAGEAITHYQLMALVYKLTGCVTWDGTLEQYEYRNGGAFRIDPRVSWKAEGAIFRSSSKWIQGGEGVARPIGLDRMRMLCSKVCDPSWRRILLEFCGGLRPDEQDLPEIPKLEMARMLRAMTGIQAGEREALQAPQKAVKMTMQQRKMIEAEFQAKKGESMVEQAFNAISFFDEEE